MNILALDTTDDALSVALKAGDRIFTVDKPGRRPHDETLLPAVDSLLKKAKLALKDLDAIAAASGPGRFTGIRIGMAYAAVAAGQIGIPALAVTRFSAIAFKVPGERVCAVVPGWREERAYQLFRRGRGAPKAEGGPVWVAAADWPGVRKSVEDKSWIVAELRTGASDLLEPASFHLSRRRLPKFEPLYLKPAGYERKQHPAGAAR